MAKKAEAEEIKAAASLAVLLWEGHTVQELTEEFRQIVEKGNGQIFLQYVKDVPVGFAQCQLRTDYVEGTESSPVGYLEGIFVKKEYRCRGFAREMLAACEEWAREKGCTEFASDCEIDNLQSLRFHESVGFTQANRIICFTKKL